LTITALFLCESGLSFTYAAGTRQRGLSWVRVPLDSLPYFTVSDLRLPFSSPPTTRRVTVVVFDPASTQGNSLLTNCRAYNISRMDRTQNTVPLLLCNCCVRVCWGSLVIAIQPMSSNGRCMQSCYLTTALIYLLSGRCLVTGLHATILYFSYT
jgi:hypothetical protein